MTLATTPPLTDYVENGVTLVHAIPFQFSATSEIVCSRIDAAGVESVLTQGVDFTVAGGGGAAGYATGSVTKANGGVNGQTFRIKRVTPRSQPTDYTPGDAFPAVSHEHALDREMAVAQEQEVELGDLDQRVTDAEMEVASLGATITSPMRLALFVTAALTLVPIGTDAVETNGYAVAGTGGAIYVADGAVNAAYVTAHPRSSFVSANGRGFRLAVDQDLHVTMVGATGDGIADDTAAAQYAHDLLSTGGRIVFTARGTYKITTVNITYPDVTIEAYGAVVTSASTASAASINLNGDRGRLLGGIWKLTGGSDNPWFFNVSGKDCTIEVERTIKTPDAGGYQAYFRHTADGATLRNSIMEGSNGVFVECSNAAFLHNRLIGRATGGDDGFAIKGLNDNCRNIRIEGNYFENLAAGLSIGSEVGVLAANDATYSRTVGQVVFIGNTLKNCYGIAFIKPGGISGADFRDGTVEDVTISDNTLIDESGTKFSRGIAITPGRGARVRGVYGKGNMIRGRTPGGVGRLVGALDVYITDYAGGTAEANVSGVYLEINYWDSWNGVANGAGGAPGYPVTHVAAVLRAGAVGTATDIVLDIRGNGSSEAGLVVGPTLMDAVRIDRLELSQVNVTNAAGQGGMYFESRVQAADGYIDVVPAAGPVLTVVGAGQLVTETTTLTGDVTGTASETAGATSIAATIAANAVGLTKLADIATDSLIGRDTAAAGDPEVIGVTGGIEFTGTGSIRTSAFTGDVTKAAGGTTQTIAAGAVTYAKMQNVSATDKLLGRFSAGAGVVEEITCTAAGRALIDDADAATQRTTLGLAAIAASGSASDLIAGTLPAGRFPALAGDVTTAGGALATTIAANAVTDAKLRQSAGLSVVGRSANTTGNVADITGAANGVLRISGTTLAFGAVDLATAMVTGDLPFANFVPATAASRLVGRGSAGGAGDFQEITLSSLLKLTGTVLSRQMRGAMVKRAADWLTQDMSTGLTIPWDAEVYDTDTIHDNVTNNTRLTSPTGSTYVRCGCTMTLANLTAGVDLTVAIRKNGSTSYDGCAQMTVDAASAAPCVNISTGPVPVTGGTDYFEVVVFTPTDTTVDLTAARSNFWMEVLEL